MSLLQKFSKLFKQKDIFADSLTLLLKPKTQKEFEQAFAQFATILLKYPREVFGMLRDSEQMDKHSPKAEHLLNLLYVIHKCLGIEQIADQMRLSPIHWLNKLMDENRDSFRVVERMMTEPSSSSFFPQAMCMTQQSNVMSKAESVQDKRKNKIQMNQELQNPNIKTEYEITVTEIKPKIFCVIYYSYLQKLSANLPIYEAVKEQRYPYEDPDQIRMKFIWLYKIQNNMQLGLKMLQCKNLKFQTYQDLVYIDMFQFQSFIAKEMDQLIEQYATISSLDTLSLFEIYQEFQKSNAILSSYKNMPITLKTSNRMIEEFLGFSIKLKVLNQFQFKKTIKVPTQDKPCLDEQIGYKKNKERAVSDFNKENEVLNVQDLKSEYVFEREVQDKQYYNRSTEQSIEVDQLPVRGIHTKTLSTFHY